MARYDRRSSETLCYRSSVRCPLHNPYIAVKQLLWGGWHQGRKHLTFLGLAGRRRVNWPWLGQEHGLGDLLRSFQWTKKSYVWMLMVHLSWKRSLVAGAAEVSRWLEPAPNSIHFSPTAAKFVRPVRESFLSASQHAQSHILHSWWDGAWDRAKHGNVNGGSMKHLHLLKSRSGQCPRWDILASHFSCKSRTRRQWEAGLSPHPCSKWALSNHSSPEWPQAAWPGGGQWGHFEHQCPYIWSCWKER